MPKRTCGKERPQRRAKIGLPSFLRPKMRLNARRFWDGLQHWIVFRGCLSVRFSGKWNRILTAIFASAFSHSLDPKQK
jgi:hypothetical protein